MTMYKMRNFGFYLFFCAWFLIISCGEDEIIEPVDVCETNRFTQEVFNGVTLSENVIYARAVGVTNLEQILVMDVYEPAQDADLDKRPLIIWVHGGSFFSGDKTELADLCQMGAKRGFVTATTNYRMLNFANGLPDTTALTDIVIKATRDLKSAVNFFVDDARGANKYKIDTTKIFVGGVSAGAITALHATYLDDNDGQPDFLKKAIANNSGLEPRPTSPAKSRIKAVISLSGAIINTNVLQKEEAPIYSIHGDADDVVPIQKGFVGGQSLAILEMFGSQSIDTYAKSIGLPSSFIKVPGGGHVDIYFDAKYASQITQFNTNVYNGLKDFICQ